LEGDIDKPSALESDALAPGRGGMKAALELTARAIVLGLICLAVSWAAVSLSRTTGSVAAIWPSSAILLGVLLRSRASRWAAYLLAGYAAGFAANLIYGDNLAIAAGLPLGNVVETLAAALLLRRCFPLGVDLSEIRHLAAVVLIAVLAAAACGATIGATILNVTNAGDFWRSWFNWWTGVGTGILIILPFMLAWRPAGDTAAPTAERPTESALAICCAAGGTALLFNQQAASLLYGIFPLLIWAGLRLGVYMTAAVCLVIAAIAVPLTAFGHGPLAALNLALDMKLRLLQTFLSVITFTSLSVAIVLQRRETTEQALRVSEQRFRDFADSISDRFWETDENHRFTWRLEPSEQLRLWPSMIGKTRFELAGGDPLRSAHWQKHLDDLNARRPFRDFRYSLRDASGRLRFRSISGKPIYGGNGKFLGYRGTSTDITDNMETELLATRLGRVVDEALNEIYIIDVQTYRFIFANRRARENLGYGMDELSGMTLLDLCPGVSKDQLLRHYADLDMRRQQSLILDSSFQRKDGSSYDVEAHLQRFDVSGLSPIYTLIVNDTTLRKRIYSELASKSSLLQATLDNMAEGFSVYDEHLKLAGYNEKFLTFLGLPPDTVHIGSDYSRNVGNFARHTLRLSEPEIPAYVADRLSEAQARFARRRLHRRPDGSIILSNRRPMPGGGFVTTFSDVTERVQTEEALRQSATELQDTKASFEAAILASRQILYEWDLVDNNIRWSGETSALLGYAPGELGGMDRFMSHIHPDDLAHVEARREEEIGVSFNLEYRLRHKSGHHVHVSDNGVYLAGRAGKTKRVVGFIADVTLQKSAAESLRHSDKMMAVGQLTGGIAHDFNNLLAIVRGNLELLAEDLAQDGKLLQRVQTALSAADRGAALTQRLLAFARKQPLETQVSNLNRLIADMDDLLRRSLPANITFETSLADDLWLTAIDPNGLENALLNLVLNARDAMPQGGRISIATSNARLDDAFTANLADVRPGQYVMLAVTDDGHGMPTEVRQRVFDPFFTTKEAGRGSGLGLAMVYGFVNQSHGHITVDSEPSLGTTFRLYLPREGASLQAEAPPAQLTSGIDGETGELILIVEDDADVRQLANSILKSLGYRTLLAEDAGTAINILAAHPGIDLLFTDIILPGGMNGADLAAIAGERYPGLKVLFTSGYTENANIHGIGTESHLISKPYRKLDLARKLRQVLEGEADHGR